MRHRIFLLVGGLVAGPLLGALAATGCSSVIVLDDDDALDGGADAKGDGKTDGGKHDGDSGKDALDEFIDPGCPDAGPPIQQFECDPYDQFNGDCENGFGCYIYVQYPSEPCGQEIYGSTCAPAGFGTQGDPCGTATDCGGGYVCVVTGSGDQCVHLCPLEGDDGCPPGLVCEPIDVQGFGGCL